MIRKSMLNLQKHKSSFLWVIIVFFISFHSAYATENWTINLTPSAMGMSFNGNSPIRNHLWTLGAVLDAQYLEKFGFAIGEQRLILDYKFNITTLTQNTEYLSFRKFDYIDGAQGVFKYRLDGYYIRSTDVTNETNDVRVIAPIISYLNYKQNIYGDLGYAYSVYGQSKIGNGSLKINQITPTLGFAFNEKKDWLQIRLYDIYYSNQKRALYNNHTDAAEFKLTHYLFPYFFWYPEFIQASVLVGNRLYAVDDDALIVYNLGDMQKQSGFLAAQWRLNRYVRWYVQGGFMCFETNVFKFKPHTNYSQNYIYSGLTFRF